jgi:fatty-acyl-CoA synthase/long-chain acyl-CoA synthetase
MQHDEVRAVAVIGIPHDDWGESVHACVVRANDDLSEPDLIAWARARLAAYATPKSVAFVDALPETPLGKIDKKVLRAQYWESRSREIA